MAAEFLFHRHADLPHGGACPGGFDRPFQQIAAFLGAAGQFLQRGGAGVLVALRADTFEARDLRLAHRDVVDIENVDRVFLVLAISIDTNDDLFAPVDHGLTPCGGFFDA